MLVKVYSDHIAYTLEENETMFSLGNRVISKLNLETIIESNSVKVNGCDRLLYDLQGLKPIQESLPVLKQQEIITLLKSFIHLIKELDESDFIDIHAVDVYRERIFYDTASKKLRCVVLPVNTNYHIHDGMEWQEKYRNTLILFCNYIFRMRPTDYNYFYYFIMDSSRTDIEITNYLIEYNFEGADIRDEKNHFTEKHVANTVGAEEKINNKVLTLEHNREGENYTFRICQQEYTIGKSAKYANGVINCSSSVSRKHCLIRRVGDGFTIEDLGSMNGTWINGYKLETAKSYTIQDGDMIQLADVVLIARIG